MNKEEFYMQLQEVLQPSWTDLLLPLSFILSFLAFAWITFIIIVDGGFGYHKRTCCNNCSYTKASSTNWAGIDKNGVCPSCGQKINDKTFTEKTVKRAWAGTWWKPWTWFCVKFKERGE